MNRRMELAEAIDAGSRALDSLKRAKQKLGSAGGWGLFDLFGGKGLTALIKHGKVASAAEYVEKYELARDNFDKLYNEANDAYTPDIVAKLKDILDSAKEDYEKLKELVKVMADEKEDDLVLDLEAKYAEEIGVKVEDKVENEETATDTFNKYSVPANSIVYERYSNGKAFILNFNNYTVKVYFEGVYYTVDAYGYVIIN